ncbi:MAG: hypothetical protein ACAI44_08255, partial [Candidatus Sericytochromatia bacterium]
IRQTGTGIEADPRLWLHPEVLTLLRARNQPQRILLFAMAALFAGTKENYLTEADQDWIRELMQRAGFPLEPKIIQRVVEQTFIFPERVHRLYESMLAEPIEIVPEHFEQYRENLAKLYIYEVASRYGAEPRNVIRTLASHWQEAAIGLQQALAQAQPVQEQYARFQLRKMASSTVFQKLRLVEEVVLEKFESLQVIAREIEALKQVTRLIEEEGALERLNQFRSELVLLPDERIGDIPISLYELREKFVRAQLEALRLPAGPAIMPPESMELSPVEQKHAISRAKEGEIKSLRVIENYKAWRIAQLNQPVQAAEKPPEPTGGTGPLPEAAARQGAGTTPAAEVATETGPADFDVSSPVAAVVPPLSYASTEPEPPAEVYEKIPGAELFEAPSEPTLPDTPEPSPETGA